MQLFKTATAQTVRSLLASPTQWPAATAPHLPTGYELKQAGSGAYLEKTYVYHDFKQAFCHLTLMAKTCHQVGYAPSIFNVYNRIVLKLATAVPDGSRITARDVYMAHLLDEVHAKTADEAHQSVLSKLQQL